MAWCPTCRFNASHGKIIEDRCIKCWKTEAERLQKENLDLKKPRQLRHPDAQKIPCCIP
jgi:hypothetical protein